MVLLAGGCTGEGGPTVRLVHSGVVIDSLSGRELVAAPAVALPSRLLATEDFLWLADAAGDPGLHLVDRRTGELLWSGGSRGDGLGEFASRPFGLLQDPDVAGAVWAFDAELQRLTRFVRGLRVEVDSVLPLIEADADPRVTRVTRLRGDTFVGTTGSEEARLVVLLADGTPTRVVPSSLRFSAEVPVAERRRALDQGVQICPWPGRGFVIVNFNVGRVEYYDEEAHFLWVADVPFPSEPSFVPVKQDDGSTTLRFQSDLKHYLDCAAAGDRLFTLFSGEVYDAGASVAPGAVGHFLHEFDSRGTLRGVYWLDRPVHALSASPEGETLYGGSISDGRVYAFPVPPQRSSIK